MVLVCAVCVCVCVCVCFFVCVCVRVYWFVRWSRGVGGMCACMCSRGRGRKGLKGVYSVRMRKGLKGATLLHAKGFEGRATLYTIPPAFPCRPGQTQTRTGQCSESLNALANPRGSGRWVYYTGPSTMHPCALHQQLE